MNEHEFKENAFTKATTYEEAAKQYSVLEWAAQLSEEADELAKAALKFRRTLSPECIPTPVSMDDAVDNLLEEISDVNICFAEIFRRLELTHEQILKRENQFVDMKKARFLERHNEHVDRYAAFLKCRKISEQMKGNDSQ